MFSVHSRPAGERRGRNRPHSFDQTYQEWTRNPWIETSLDQNPPGLQPADLSTRGMPNHIGWRLHRPSEEATQRPDKRLPAQWLVHWSIYD